MSLQIVDLWFSKCGFSLRQGDLAMGSSGAGPGFRTMHSALEGFQEELCSSLQGRSQAEQFFSQSASLA
jgi:hypothetical protein